jgi:transcriptional regulator with XRE-family HTH domain
MASVVDLRSRKVLAFQSRNGPIRGVRAVVQRTHGRDRAIAVLESSLKEVSEPETTSPLLGDLVRFYRLRMRQVHNGSPWAQEDLAVAIRSDKAHINRIERGRCVPTRQTLLRISGALNLTWEERLHVLSLVGYSLEPLSPSSTDVAEITRRESSVLEAATYSMSLLDTEGRIWDVNEINAYAYFGFPNREACLRAIGGKRMIDILLDKARARWFEKTVVDYEAFIRRQLARFRRAYNVRPHDQHYRGVLSRILEHPQLAVIWAEVASEDLQHRLPHFLDHQVVTVNHPHLGRYTVQIWHTTLTSDERFYLSHHIPADSRSGAIFSELAARVRSKAAGATLRGRTQPHN